MKNDYTILNGNVSDDKLSLKKEKGGGQWEGGDVGKWFEREQLDMECNDKGYFLIYFKWNYQ